MASQRTLEWKRRAAARSVKAPQARNRIAKSQRGALTRIAHGRLAGYSRGSKSPHVLALG